MKKFLVALAIIVLAGSCNRQTTTVSTIPSATANMKPSRTARNVILLIGDGMGMAQISAGMYSNQNSLNLEQFPVVGIHKSYSYDDLITDSAAGATAFASGVKTYNGAIGVKPDTSRVKTILEEAMSKGYATGLVATSTIVHATPAAFYAHVKSRKMYEEIATAVLENPVDYYVGGGKKFFDRRESDERNIIEEMKDKGYMVSSYFEQEITEVNPDPLKKFAFFTADEDPIPAARGRDYLTPASKLATQFLDGRSEKGFFLMVEGSQIDWGGHSNNSDYIITEMLDFNKTIGAILEFAKADGETLVVVTADHETGGYALNPGSEMGKIEAGFTTDYHTAAMIPVFAYGPGSEIFAGIYENTEIYRRLKLAMGL